MPRVCPWWIGYLLLNPFRRVAQSPRRLLSPLVREGMTLLEVGPGLGFFTLDLARMVGPEGHVVAVDVQSRMVEGLRRRVRNAGLEHHVDVRLTPAGRLDVEDLAGRVDLALAIYVVHEIEDKASLFAQLRRVLAPSGRLLVVEPPLHVSRRSFETTLDLARRVGLREVDRPRWRGCKTVLLAPPPDGSGFGGR
jgi:ubiquinone/menaquinone biosynthesis C-methylase UbiE